MSLDQKQWSPRYKGIFSLEKRYFPRVNKTLKIIPWPEVMIMPHEEDIIL